MSEPTKTRDFVHTHDYNAAGEPDWKTVEIQKLPPEAYAMADGEDSTAWKHPHHYVESAASPDEHGRWTSGTLKVHTGQLKVAFEAATAEGDALAIAHMDAHRKTIDPDLDGHPLKDLAGIKAHGQTVTRPRYSFSAPVKMEVKDNGEGSKSAPITLVALSGEVLDRPEWGPCIQDLSGMMHKGRIAIDYMHNPNELIGYVNRFDVGEQLVLTGALVPQKTHQRTEEVIDNMKAGVPYEASIYFPPSYPGDLLIEQYEPGATVDVNGKTLVAGAEGLTVFRKWSLRGVAVCPHGADGGTAAFLQADSAAAASAIIVKVPKAATEQAAAAKEKVMDKPEVKPEVKAEEAPVKQEAPKVDDAVKPEGEKKECEGKGEGEGLTGWRASLKKFTNKFGATKAVEYMTAGKTYAEALEMYADEMRAKMEAAAAQTAAAAAKPGEAKANPKPSIPFEQAGAVEGCELSAAEVEAFKQYAEERGLTDAQVTRLMKLHPKFKQESRRLGVYQPSPGATSIKDAEGGSLTKTGQE